MASARTPLEPATVWQHVNDVLDEINPSIAEKLGIRLRPITDWAAVEGGSKDSSRPEAPLYFGLQIVNTDGHTNKGPSPDTNEVSFISFYVGYSTWEGLCVFVDQLGGTGHQGNKQLFLQILAKIAIRTGSKRLTWKAYPPHPDWYQFNPVGPPDILDDLHILQLDRMGMEAYVDYSPGERAPTLPLDRSSVEEQSKAVLESPQFNESSENFSIRLARADNADDANAMERLVKGLAVYAREPLEDIHCDAQDYLVDGSGNYPIYYCFLLEPLSDNGNGSPMSGEENGANQARGIAVVYFGHSHESGRFLYLEDLYVDEAYRHRGAGRLALKMLTTLGLAMGCNSFQWLALEWNKPALDLYQNKMGAKIQEGKKVTRFTGDKLKEFAASFSSTLEGI